MHPQVQFQIPSRPGPLPPSQRFKDNPKDKRLFRLHPTQTLQRDLPQRDPLLLPRIFLQLLAFPDLPPPTYHQALLHSDKGNREILQI